MTLIYRIATGLLRGFFRLCYHLSVEGIEDPYRGKAIIAPNHASFLDPPLISATWPEEVHFLARSTLFQPSSARIILSRLNAHPVDGSAQDVQSFRLICRLLKEDQKVVIFPEGERSITGKLQKIKPGIAMLAIRMQCPIIPVYIQGTFEAWPKQSRWPKFGSPILCVYGKPIFPPSALENANKKEMQEQLTQQVQNQMEEMRLNNSYCR
jgi:1-acyl-sn-glycerol-3-phosphate acyltransferase